MARPSYLPLKDADFLAWTLNFAQCLTEDGTALGIPAAMATEYAAKQADFAAKLTAATNESTRGKRTIFLKDESRTFLLAMTRKLAQSLNKNYAITDDQRLAFQLPIPSGHRVPTPPPDEAPLLNATATDGRTVTLELRQATPRRGRPAGTTAAIIFTASTDVGVAAPPLGDPAWQFNQLTSLMSVRVDCGSSATGDTVHFLACYTNAKGESGPSAKAISVALPAGGVVAAAVERMKLRAA